MIFEDGEIKVSPRLIYWIECPSSITEPVRIELLKRDILVVTFEGDFQRLPELIKVADDYSCFFFNIDKIFIQNKIGQETRIYFIQNLAQLIQRLGQDKCLVHTTSADPVLERFFKDAGIGFREINFLNRDQATSDIMTIVENLLKINSSINRSYIRINLTQVRYIVRITPLTDKTRQVAARCKDLSINGMALILDNPDDKVVFNLKTPVMVKLELPGQLCTINKAFVTRISEKESEIGISFDLLNTTIIGTEDASRLAKIVHNWILSIITTHGHMKIHEGGVND